jgi:hypothetical protein
MSTGPIDFGTSVTAPARPPTQGERDQLLRAIGGLKNRSDWFQVVYPGDDILELYGAFTEVEGLTSTNRGTFLMMPGVYELPGIWELQSNIDVIGVGTTDKNPAVKIVGAEGVAGLVVRGSNVLVQGVESNIFRVSLDITDVVCEDCVAGDFGFSFVTSGIDESPYNTSVIIAAPGTTAEWASLYLENCVFTRCVAGSYSFGPSLYGCTLKDCEASHFSFGSHRIEFGCLFENCVGGNWCFAGFNTELDNPFPGLPDGHISDSTFRNCRALTGHSFGSGAVISSSFYNCSAASGATFLGENYFENNLFEDCVTGPNSFGPYSSLAGCAFRRCNAGDFSYGSFAFLSTGGGSAPTLFEDCVGGDYCFGANAIPFLLPNGDFAYKFTNCRAGYHSFGAEGCFGEFVNCIGRSGSFGGNSGNCVGRFIGCRLGTVSSRFDASALDFPSFGGFGGALYGYFEDCDIPLVANLSQSLEDYVIPELLTFEAVNCFFYAPDSSALHVSGSPGNFELHFRDCVFYFNYGEGSANLAAVRTALESAGVTDNVVNMYNCYAVVSSAASATNPESMKRPPSLSSVPLSE